MFRGFRYIFFITTALAVVCAGIAEAQPTKISGKITSSTTGKPVPYASIFFKNATSGVTSDTNGYYVLVSAKPGDSLCASSIGFRTMTKPARKGVSQVIDFSILETTTNLKVVEIAPEERWVNILMRRVVRSKDKNNPDQINYYQCQAYNKIQIDLNNLSEDMQKSRLLRPIDFVFNNLDTSELNQKVFLPTLLTETVSDYYFRKSPRATREYVQASHISGVDNQSLTQYLGGLFLNMNIYDNYINVFDKNFVSPIANFCLSTYKYDLEDTVVVDGSTCFKIRFEPKRKQELTFYGTLWINDTSLAVKQVDMRVAVDANFNWVNDFYISQTYDKVNDQYWALTRDYRLVDLNPFKATNMKALGIFGHRTTTYSNYIFDKPKSDEFYSTPTNVIIENDAYERDKDWWQENRPDSLQASEQQIYDMVDSVKKVPAYKYYERTATLIGSGYWVAGKFEIGPVYKFLSFNAIEGARIRFGGRTSNDFSKKVMLEGHVAYGTLDHQFKYAMGLTYMLGKDPRRSIGASFKYDMEQLGQDPNAFSEDNFFASFFRRSPADKLTMVREYDGFYEHEWFNGFSNTVKFIRREVYAIGDDKFMINDYGHQYIDNTLVSNEIQLYTRFAYRERYLYGEFVRTSLGTKYPVLELIYGYGIPSLPGSDAEYHRLQFKVKQWFNVANIGWSKYIFEMGKIWGRVPYPFLKIHEGNETFFYYTEAGNLMNYYEFISDRYASLFYIHHFDGYFFNKIPLMKKLKWREVVTGRAVWGTLTDQNKEYSVFPTGSGELNKPYFEVGCGIENIFKVGRIDAVWRLSHLDNPNAKPFGIFISANFSF
jgi:hypothetical protein